MYTNGEPHLFCNTVPTWERYGYSPGVERAPAVSRYRVQPRWIDAIYADHKIDLEMYTDAMSLTRAPGAERRIENATALEQRRKRMRYEREAAE
eukprot:gene10527-4880_t